MFKHCWRKDTNYVAGFWVSTTRFRIIKSSDSYISPITRFPRHLEENEFILLLEARNSKPTGNEVTLFVNQIKGRDTEAESYVFTVVNGNPDTFWKQQKLEV